MDQKDKEALKMDYRTLLDRDIEALHSMVPEMYKVLKAVQDAWMGDIKGYKDAIDEVDRMIEKIEAKLF